MTKGSVKILKEQPMQNSIIHQLAGSKVLDHKVVLQHPDCPEDSEFYQYMSALYLQTTFRWRHL